MLAQDEIGKKQLLLYLATMCLCVAMALAVVWTYTATQGIRFLESGYAVWQAKRTMLRDCDVGEIVVFGDSRADSAIVPAQFSKTASNFGFAGATPIENYFFVKALLSCKTRPKTLILSFNPNAFEIVQPWLWDNAMRYGAIGWNEAALVRDEARRLGDQTYFQIKPQMGIDGFFRDILYASGFPAIYFNSLLESRVLFRAELNARKFAEVMHARGYPSYGKGGQGPVMPSPGDSARFVPLALQKSFFEKTVALLDEAGINTYLLLTPHNEKSANAHNPLYTDAYLSLLHSVETQYRRIRLLQQQIPVWPAGMFADGAHLNEEGATAFSKQLNSCIENHYTNVGSSLQCDFALDTKLVSLGINQSAP